MQQLEDQIDFTKLADDLLERLDHVVEECSEVTKAIIKIRRHGFVATDPFTSKQYNNQEDLQREVRDLMAALTRMAYGGEIDWTDLYQPTAKQLNNNKYLKHQKKLPE